MKIGLINVCLFINFALLPSATMAKLISVDFEVFGVVQGVFFRKYTQKEAKGLDLRGWCMNTNNDTVKGVIEGEQKKVEEMKHWLQHVGSPSSRIDKAVFTNQKEIESYSYDSFKIKH